MSTTLYLRFPKSTRSAKEVKVSSQEKITVGRVDCDITLSEYFPNRAIKFASKKHYEILWHNEQFVIVDLDSTNGTWVNRSRLTARQPRILADGDVIKIANQYHLQFQVQIKRLIKPEDTQPIPADLLLASRLEQLQKERDLMLLGVAGMGKTTLMSRLIPQNETQDLFKRYWPNHESFLFCCLDGLAIRETTLPAFFRSLIGTTKSAFKSWPDEIKRSNEFLARGNCSPMQMRDAVVTTIQTVQRQLGKRIIFLLDHFDNLYPKLPSELFWVLRELKRVQPPVIYVIAMRNEFNDSNQHIHQFLRVINPPNYYWLPAMSENELKSIISEDGLSTEQVTKSIELGGGQPTFTILVANALKHMKRMPNDSGLIRQLLANNLVNYHCRQIWKSLSIEEQKALSSVANGEAKMPYRVERDLREKKRLLIGELEDLRMQNPLFAAYVRSRQPAVPKRKRPTPPATTKQPMVRAASGEEIKINGQSIPRKKLTQQQEKLLIYMHSKAGQVCSHDDLWKEVWGYESDNPPSQASIASLIKNLRKKLDEISLGKGKRYIRTVHGRGYMYSPNIPS